MELQTVHLILKTRPARAGYDEFVRPDPKAVPAPGTRERAIELVQRQPGVQIVSSGKRFITVVAHSDVLTKLFGSAVIETALERYFENDPVIPAEWREVISTAIAPPKVGY